MSLRDINRTYYIMVQNDGCITARTRHELLTAMDTLEATGKRFTVSSG